MVFRGSRASSIDDVASAMRMENHHDQRRNMLTHYIDVPNCITALGLLFSISAIFFAIRGDYAASMLMLLWATLCDWLDGPAARLSTGRAEDNRRFGAQIDSFADLVSSSVTPAIVLMSIGNYSVYYLPGALVLIFAGVTRLAYFNIYGIGVEKRFVGVPVPANVIAITLVFTLHGMVAETLFSILLYSVLVVMSGLNVSPVRVPKPTGIWYLIIVFYVLLLSVLFASRI